MSKYVLAAAVATATVMTASEASVLHTLQAQIHSELALNPAPPQDQDQEQWSLAPIHTKHNAPAKNPITTNSGANLGHFSPQAKPARINKGDEQIPSFNLGDLFKNLPQLFPSPSGSATSPIRGGGGSYTPPVPPAPVPPAPVPPAPVPPTLPQPHMIQEAGMEEQWEIHIPLPGGWSIELGEEDKQQPQDEETKAAPSIVQNPRFKPQKYSISYISPGTYKPGNREEDEEEQKVSKSNIHGGKHKGGYSASEEDAEQATAATLVGGLKTHTTTPFPPITTPPNPRRKLILDGSVISEPLSPLEEENNDDQEQWNKVPIMREPIHLDLWEEKPADMDEEQWRIIKIATTRSPIRGSSGTGVISLEEGDDEQYSRATIGHGPRHVNSPSPVSGSGTWDEDDEQKASKSNIHGGKHKGGYSASEEDAEQATAATLVGGLKTRTTTQFPPITTPPNPRRKLILDGSVITQPLSPLEEENNDDQEQIKAINLGTKGNNGPRIIRIGTSKSPVKGSGTVISLGEDDEAAGAEAEAEASPFDMKTMAIPNDGVFGSKLPAQRSVHGTTKPSSKLDQAMQSVDNLDAKLNKFDELRKAAKAPRKNPAFAGISGDYGRY